MTLAATNSGVARRSPTVRRSLPRSTPPETPAHKKLRKAAQEFEGILISQLLGEFQDGLFVSHRGYPAGRVRYLELIGNSDLIDGLGQPRRAGNWANAGSPARAQFESGPAKSRKSWLVA